MQVSSTYIVFIVVIITCSLVAAAAALMLYVRLYNERKRRHFEEKQLMADEFERQLMQSQLETQEETKSILSKELHDNIGQLLNSTKLLIGVAQRSMDNLPDTLVTADETLGLAIQELRALSRSLDKDWLSQFNFVENLEAEVQRINGSGRLQLFFTRPEELPLAAGEQTILFRIVQEIIQNTLKHAKAASIHIRVNRYHGKIMLAVSDDGRGFDSFVSPEGMGIRNIRHRVQLLGGVVRWESFEDKGTTVFIELPVKQELA